MSSHRQRILLEQETTVDELRAELEFSHIEQRISEQKLKLENDSADLQKRKRLAIAMAKIVTLNNNTCEDRSSFDNDDLEEFERVLRKEAMTGSEEKIMGPQVTSSDVLEKQIENSIFLQDKRIEFSENLRRGVFRLLVSALGFVHRLQPLFREIDGNINSAREFLDTKQRRWREKHAYEKYQALGEKSASGLATRLGVSG